MPWDELWAREETRRAAEQLERSGTTVTWRRLLVPVGAVLVVGAILLAIARAA